MKRFIIYRLYSDGRPEIHAHTNLGSEVERFEDLGFLVVDTAPTDTGHAV